MWTTVLALALINIGVATAIVSAMGTATFAPMWVGLVLLGAGVLAAVAAVFLWREYLFAIRGR